MEENHAVFPRQTPITALKAIMVAGCAIDDTTDCPRRIAYMVEIAKAAIERAGEELPRGV